MKKINERVEAFMESLVKVTVIAENDNGESSAVEIGKPEEFSVLRERAHSRVLEYISCECIHAEKPAHSPVFVEIPAEAKKEIPEDIESLKEKPEIASEEAIAEEEDDDMSFLDDFFSETEKEQEKPAPEPEVEPEPEPEAEPEPEPEAVPEPAPKKRGRPRKVEEAAADGMTRAKALATVISVTPQATSAYESLAGMTMDELLKKKPGMAKIMIRDHIRPQLSEETIKAAEFLAK